MTTIPAQSAEEYALGILRRHRDSMTRPDFQNIADDAALAAREVERLWEQLLAGRDPKPLDRPRAVPVPPVQAVTPGPVEAPPSWLSAKDHPSARIRGKYRKAVAAVADLEAALLAEVEKDKLREKEARLAAQLAKVRAELRGGVSQMSPKPAATHTCPSCGKGFTSAQGFGLHRTRTGCGAHTIQVAQ